MKTIGTTFASELKAAGLLGLQFSWGSDGQIIFDDNLTSVQRGSVMAVYDAHDPAASDKATKWEAIKAERDRRTDTGGYKVGTKWFHNDQKSRSQQLGLVLLGANIPANLQWKTMDGAFVSMTSALSQQILGAAAASDQAIFTIAETHKAAMEASADPSSYDFTTGWPLMYGEG